MRYKPKAKEYDSCYYYIHTSTLDGEVTAEQLEQMKKESPMDDVSIYFKLTKKSEMNVHLYGGGPNRKDANDELIDGHAHAKLGREYQVSVTKGLLVVAFPNRNKKTEFAFEYWIGPTTPMGWFNNPTIFYAISANLLLCVLVIPIHKYTEA